MSRCRRALSFLALPVLFSAGLTMAQEKTSRAQGLFEGSADIGAALKGSMVYDAQRGEYRIAGGGADMWEAVDAFI
jgi:hypothetical protein